MRIVDAQIHLWGSGLPSNMAHRQVTSFTTEEAVGLMDEGGVDAAVIHPPGWDPKSTEMAFKAVRDFPGRFAILGAFPLNQPDKRALVDTWRSQPGMLGLRYGFLQEPMRGLAGRWDAHRPDRRAASGPAADHRPPGRHHHPEGRRRNGAHAGADQAGTASQRGCQGDRRTGLLQRTVPVHEHAPVLAPDLRRVRTGAHVLGTDITKMPCSWRQCVTMFTEELPWLSERDKDLVMGQAVCAWWGWNQPG